MASVVFLRGVNVGGHKAFQPSVLARELAALDVRSIGAAGTFVVRAPATAAEIRAQFLRRLPFEPRVMVCAAKDLVKLAAANPFARYAGDAAIGPFVSVLERRIPRAPQLPHFSPAERGWQVQVLAVQGCFVMSAMRKTGRAGLYPNEVVERYLGVPATTRGWPTILRIHAALQA